VKRREREEEIRVIMKRSKYKGTLGKNKKENRSIQKEKQRHWN